MRMKNKFTLKSTLKETPNLYEVLLLWYYDSSICVYDVAVETNIPDKSLHFGRPEQLVSDASEEGIGIFSVPCELENLQQIDYAALKQMEFDDGKK